MTIVVDTSAVIAILFGEPEEEAFGRLIEDSDTLMSTGSVIEAMRVVMVTRGVGMVPSVRAFLQDFGVRLVAPTEAQTHLAEEGMLRFGIGRAAPPAVLNFGDLFAYALARHVDAPLLFKGNDFTRTDVRAAVP